MVNVPIVYSYNDDEKTLHSDRPNNNDLDDINTPTGLLNHYRWAAGHAENAQLQDCSPRFFRV
jgi:hypothetical protein